MKEFYYMKERKTFLVTGATSGVGFEIVKILCGKGEHVIATGRNKEKLALLKQEGAEIAQVDLLNDGQRKAFIEQINQVDVVMLSAGVGTFEYADRIRDEAIENMLKLNVEVPMKMARDLLHQLPDGGQLIFIGSQAGKVATPKASVYAATKHALIGYTNALRLELKQRNIAVTVIHPGPIDTPFIDHADQTAMYRKAMGRILLKPEIVAEKAVHTIHTRKREVNIPWYMGVSSKLYTISPKMVELFGKSFFNKK